MIDTYNFLFERYTHLESPVFLVFNALSIYAFQMKTDAYLNLTEVD
jgi:hypothetical protein